MATENKASSLDDEESGSSSIGRSVLHPEEPPKKKSKKTPGKQQHCIKNHRMICVDNGGKHTEADECQVLMRACFEDQQKLGVFDILFASVYRVAKHIGEPAPLIALSIMPYLMYKGETAGANAYAVESNRGKEWIDDIPWSNAEERVLIEMYMARCEEEPGYSNWLEKARYDAYDLHNFVPAWMEYELEWASCEEELSDCEFADECEFGECMCPAGYNTHFRGPAGRFYGNPNFGEFTPEGRNPNFGE